jgi:hypothetical protein
MTSGETRLAESLPAGSTGGHPDRLDDLDPEQLDYGFHGGRTRLIVVRRIYPAGGARPGTAAQTGYYADRLRRGKGRR